MNRITVIVLSALVFSLAIFQLACGIGYLTSDRVPDVINQYFVEVTGICVVIGILAMGVPMIIQDHTNTKVTNLMMLFLIIGGIGFAGIAFVIQQKTETISPYLWFYIINLIGSGANFVMALEWDR